METVSREGLVCVQTPQAFSADVLRRALDGPISDASDCAGFVEAAGGRVRVVEGDPRLVKVTSSPDLAFVETLLERERLSLFTRGRGGQSVTQCRLSLRAGLVGLYWRSGRPLPPRLTLFCFFTLCQAINREPA